MDKCRALEVPARGCSRLGSLWRMLIPSATVFFTGGCLMILELVASRLAARSIGSSLYTWTAIVAVVLAGIALGNYLGGRIADRYHPRRALSVLLGLSSAACIGVVVSNNLAGGGMWLWRLSWPSHVFIHVLLVFFLPSTLLGAINPVAVKMALDQGLAAGRTVGSLYAWGVAGGIVGTLLAGFCLIVTFGNVAIIWFIGAALLMMAVLYWISCWALYLWAMVFIALATMGMADDKWAQDAGRAALLREPPDPNVVYEAQTLYGYVAVKRVSQRPDTRVFIQDKSTRGAMVAGDAIHPRSFHLKVYAGLTRGVGEDKKNLSMLVLGAGGYVFPRYLKATWPDSHVEVVEADPGVTQAATEAFGLDKNTAIRTVSMDARNYVDRFVNGGRRGKAANHYSFIYGDVLSDCSMPAQLVTRQFNDKIADLLTEDGVYMIHLLDVDQGSRGLAFVVTTARETFPHVYAIAGPAGLASSVGDFVVVAAKRELDPQTILAAHDKHLKFTVLSDGQLDDLKKQCGGMILTDDYAPVESLFASVAKRGAMGMLARRYFDRAREWQGNGQLDQSIGCYRKALELDPMLAVEAYERIGFIYVARKQPEAAAESFCRAIKAHAETGSGQAVIGAVHMNLGGLLRRMDKLKEAKEQLAQAVESFRFELEENPKSVVVWEQLGDTSAALGDFPGVSDAFDRAAALEPRNPSHYQKLARALELQHRYDEAIAAVRKHVRLVQEQGRRDLVSQLNHYIDVLEYKKVKQAR